MIFPYRLLFLLPPVLARSRAGHDAETAGLSAYDGGVSSKKRIFF
jgi:hypothetical protein